MSKSVSIIENGEQQDITEEQATRLTEQGIVYPCDDPDCGPFLHIDPDKTWEDVDTALGN